MVGGRSQSGTASGNNVTMDSGEVYSIFGGESLGGACVSGNTVTITGGQATASTVSTTVRFQLF